VFRTTVSSFHKNDDGQDLAEYCLLVALVALIGLGLLTHFSGGIQNIWNSANQTLASGSSATSGQTGAAQPSSGQPGSGQPSSQTSSLPNNSPPVKDGK
jgi:Flp pilus assembly pilin Flp